MNDTGIGIWQKLYAVAGIDEKFGMVKALFAEIERLKADNRELLHLRDMEHGRHQLAQQEIERLKAATVVDNDEDMIEHLRDMGLKVISPEEMSALRKGGECPVCGFSGRPR